MRGDYSSRRPQMDPYQSTPSPQGMNLDMHQSQSSFSNPHDNAPPQGNFQQGYAQDSSPYAGSLREGAAGQTGLRHRSGERCVSSLFLLEA